MYGPLTGERADIFEFCDTHRTRRAIARRSPQVDPGKAEEFVARLVKLKWMYENAKGRILSLPIEAPSAGRRRARRESRCGRESDAT